MLPNFDFKNYTLLDVGCGSGIPTIYFYENSNFTKFTGFDLSKKLNNKAIKKIKIFIK